MLVLSRRVEESVHLSDSIVVQVLSIKGDRVRLGFTAPRDIRVWRSELAGQLPDRLDDDAVLQGDGQRRLCGKEMST